MEAGLYECVSCPGCVSHAHLQPLHGAVLSRSRTGSQMLAHRTSCGGHMNINEPVVYLAVSWKVSMSSVDEVADNSAHDRCSLAS